MVTKCVFDKKKKKKKKKKSQISGISVNLYSISFSCQIQYLYQPMCKAHLSYMRTGKTQVSMRRDLALWMARQTCLKDYSPNNTMTPFVVLRLFLLLHVLAMYYICKWFTRFHLFRFSLSLFSSCPRIILKLCIRITVACNWAATWQNQQNGCAPSEDSDQPGHPTSLISVFVVRSKGS